MWNLTKISIGLGALLVAMTTANADVDPEIQAAVAMKPAAGLSPAAAASTSGTRGNGLRGQQIRQNMALSYYMQMNVPDVDSACREKIYKCLSDYCGDMTAIPGVYDGRCANASEGELFNWATLCISKDFEDLMPQYGLYNRNDRAVNTAARLCPTYIQQELLSYLSMSSMAAKLGQQRSGNCTDARTELTAALACHETTMIYANESSSMLESMLTDSCGAGVTGGSRAMVQKFLNAGNVGGNVWGWVDKILSMDLSEKARGWETAVDSIAASYVNKMNAACGENMQFQAVKRAPDTSPTTLQQAANLAINLQFGADATGKTGAAGGATAFPTAGGAATGGTAGASNLTMTINSNYAVYDHATASQVVQAALTNTITTQNPFLTSQQMNEMQNARKKGTKVFMLKDGSRCFIVAVDALTAAENNMLAPQMASCAYN